MKKIFNNESYADLVWFKASRLFISPLIMLVVAYLMDRYVGSDLATAITVSTTLAIFCFITKENGDEIRASIAGSVALGILFYLLQSNYSYHNPWGVIGWVVTITMSCASSFAVYYFRERHKFGSEDWVNLVFVLSMIGLTSQIYLYWGTQFVWLPLAGYAALNIVACYSFKTWFSNTDPIKVVVTLIGIGAISTACQFWFLPIMDGIELWIVFLVASGLIISMFTVLYLIDFLKKKTKKKLLEAKQQEKIEQDHQKNLTLIAEKKKTAEELFERIKGEEKVSWIDLYKANWDGKLEIPEEMIMKTEFLEVIRISKLKSQLFYEHHYVDFAVKNLNKILEGSNDELIQKVVDQIKKLEEFKNYKGYKSLVEERLNYRYHLIRKLVKLEFPEKEEIV